MPIQKLSDIKIYYEQHGSGDDLILIGGLSADHQVWKSTLREFSKKFRVLTFDMRGAGQSDTPDYPYTTEMMANDVLQLMDALNMKRAHILGHSMGGCVAQQIALLGAKKVNKLVLVSSRAKPTAVTNMILSTRAKLKNMASISEELLAEYTMPLLFSEHFLKNTVQLKGFIHWTLMNPHPQSPIGFKNQLNAVMTHDVFLQLKKITTPTLVIAGEEDILMPAKHIKVMSEKIPNSQLVLLSECAHMPHVEKSKEFVACVMRFLSELHPPR